MDELANIAAIGAGGFIGAVARYYMTIIVQKMAGASHFPWGTFAVNMAGCLFIGLAAGLFAWASPGHRLRLISITGFIGGFTTFSTFSLETYNLFALRESALAMANAFGQVALGAALVWAGVMLARLLH